MSSHLVPTNPPKMPQQTYKQGPLGARRLGGQQRLYARERNPFRCSHCGTSHTLRAFLSVYGNGSSIDRYRRGLIFKTGWAETRRQSILAEKCSPPKKRRLFWRAAFLAFSVGALLWGRDSYIPLVAFPFDISEIGAALAVVGIFLTVDAVRWNRLKYPLRYSEWESSFFCVKCGRVTIIEVVDR